MSRQEARQLAREKHPELIEPPVAEPLRLKAGERVERFVGETSAQVKGPDGEVHAVDATLPLRSQVGSGENRLVDLGLVDRGSVLVPENPLVATRIGKQLDAGIALGGSDGGELGVRLESAGTAEAEVVEDRAFFSGALVDTDMIVLPTPRGVSLALQVRSADAPEQAVLDLELPAGASLRPVEASGANAPEGSIPGSVEVVREGKVVSIVQPAAGWDAEGEPLEGVRYTVEGDRLVVRYPHRSADVLYPLAVDPQIDRFRVDNLGHPVGNGSFVIGHQYDGEYAAWNYNNAGYGSENFVTYPAQQPYTYEHNNVLGITGASYYGYGDNSFGQWYWWAPRQSWIYRADFVNVDFTPTYQSYPRAKCLAMGLYSSTYYDWERGSMSQATDQYGNSRYVGETPWIGGPAPDGSCSTQNNNSRTHVPYSPTPGNIAVYRLFSYGTGVPTNPSHTVMDGAAVHLEDGQAPSVSSASSSPGGWVRSAQINTAVSARDAAPGTPAERGGLGMYGLALYVPVEGGGRAQHLAYANCHLRLTRCPESQASNYSYSTDDADPNTAGNQAMPEGANTIVGDAYDAIGKPTHFSAGTVKVDRSGAAAGIEGFQAGELLRGRNYTITGTASDHLSGPKGVTIKLDGQEKASRSDCPASESPCRLEWTLDATDPALTEGEHTITVTATDQVGNPASTHRSFLIDRTKPTYELDGSLLPTDTGWTASGEQDLIIDAIDEPGTATGTGPRTTGGVGEETTTVPATGATHIEARIDGNPIEAPLNQPCEVGGCELGADFVTNTDTFAEGQHTLTIVVRDGAGNTAESDPIEFKLERSPPSLTLAGTLKAAEGQTLAEGASYVLSASAADGSGPVMQSGLGRIDVAIDDDAPDAVEQPCPLGACPQSRTYTYAADDYEPGPHTVTVTATDIAGNEKTQQFTVNNPEPPPPTCTSSPEPAVAAPAASLPREFALETFRNRLPEAFRESLPTLATDLELRPLLQFDNPDVFQAAGSLNLGTVDRQAADGATIRLETDSDPICMTPGQVSDAASQPTTPIAGTTALFANAAPATDLAIRPTVTGVKTFTQIRDLTAPTDFVWNLALQPGQQLQKLPNGTVVVVEPLPGAEPSEPDPSLPPAPDIAEQRAAIADPAKQAEFASDAFQRVLEATPDEIVAIIPKPWAIDALDRPVATSLEVSGSQQVTMRVQHSALTPYPVVADPEVIMADSVDEFEVRKADANTAEYTDAEAETFEPAQPPGFVYPDPPAQRRKTRTTPTMSWMRTRLRNHQMMRARVSPRLTETLRWPRPMRQRVGHRFPPSGSPRVLRRSFTVPTAASSPRLTTARSCRGTSCARSTTRTGAPGASGSGLSCGPTGSGSRSRAGCGGMSPMPSSREALPRTSPSKP